MTQIAIPFVQGSPTSEQAAVSIEPSAGTLRAIVLEWLRANGPATDEAMQDALHLNPSTQRPRRIELYRAGLVLDTGRTALTKSGREAVLWVAKARVAQ